jgi:hypothetical protein
MHWDFSAMHWDLTILMDDQTNGHQLNFFGMSTIKSCVVFTSVEKAYDFSRHFPADKKKDKKNCDQTNGHQLNLLGCLQ